MLNGQLWDVVQLDICALNVGWVCFVAMLVLGGESLLVSEGDWCSLDVNLGLVFGAFLLLSLFSFLFWLV